VNLSIDFVRGFVRKMVYQGVVDMIGIYYPIVKLVKYILITRIYFVHAVKEE
jgi:hypothetical protein